MTSPTSHSAHSSQLPARNLDFAAVQEIVADCLGIEPSEVLPPARFFEDLGGESIDLTDLSFQFERAFQIHSPFKAFTGKELWDRDESGRLTPAARELLDREFGYLDITRRLDALPNGDPRNLLTIEMMYQMLEHAGRTIRTKVSQ